MIPSEKSSQLNAMLSRTVGVDREQAILDGVCVSCGQMAELFRDNLSREEYRISGFCQDCQDFVFGSINEPEEQ